ncbi:MAG: DUF2231 domain-containing protein [Acidimicrobiales bacterium]
MGLQEVATSIGRASLLDAVAEPLTHVVRRALPPGPRKDALSGAWLGHPVHPLLTDVPIGAFSSAAVLDLLGPRGSAGADLLVALGLAAALPTVASGLSDWADVGEEARRVGLVHLVANVAGLACYGASMLCRLRGRRGRGVAWGLAGMGAMSVGGYLGGHLVFHGS